MQIHTKAKTELNQDFIHKLLHSKDQIRITDLIDQIYDDDQRQLNTNLRDLSGEIHKWASKSEEPYDYELVITNKANHLRQERKHRSRL